MKEDRFIFGSISGMINVGLNSDTMTVLIDLATYLIGGIVASIIIKRYSDLSRKFDADRWRLNA